MPARYVCGTSKTRSRRERKSARHFHALLFCDRELCYQTVHRTLFSIRNLALADLRDATKVTQSKLTQSKQELPHTPTPLLPLPLIE
ncbi:hypothetical protein [Aerosakkonema funiforme]|uniref:hypothetical protein n=1 Tax=Aerosakkonema funiforme TaxID=1246630 RepID=UPI0035BC4A96